MTDQFIERFKAKVPQVCLMSQTPSLVGGYSIEMSHLVNDDDGEVGNSPTSVPVDLSTLLRFENWNGCWATRSTRSMCSNRSTVFFGVSVSRVFRGATYS